MISEYNQTYHTSSSCYYVLDLLCVTWLRIIYENNIFTIVIVILFIMKGRSRYGLLMKNIM